MTAATASAPKMPTPMNAATRAIPDVTTIANRRRHGLMICTRVPSVAPQPTDPAASAIASVAVAASTSILSRSADHPRCRVVFDEIAIVLALRGLRAHQPVIGAVAADQLGMPAAFDDMALVEDEDAVGADDARQPVREDQGRASRRQAVDRLLDHRLVLRVHRGERFVENEDRRIPQQRPGDRQALALAARQQDPALADHRVVTLRQQRDELVRIGVARRRLDLVAGGVGLAEPQILFDGAVEQVGVLVDDGDHPAERFGIERLDVVTADLDRAALRVEEAQQQPRNR